MNRFLLAILLLTNLPLLAQQKETIKIPAGIVYNYCEPEIVEKAKRMINEDLLNKDSYQLCQKFLIIGPQLWKRFSSIDSVNQIEGGKVKVVFDGNELDAKMSQDEEDSKKIWAAFRDEIQGKKYTIRKLNEKELRYYWAVISFDIDEPLLVVETSEHRYILNILKDDLKVMWLDEAP